MSREEREPIILAGLLAVFAISLGTALAIVGSGILW